MSVAVISPDWFVMDRLAHSWKRFSQDLLVWHASLTAWERRSQPAELLIFDAQNPVSLSDLVWLKRLALQTPTLLLHSADLTAEDLDDSTAAWTPIPANTDEDSLRVAAIAARLRHRGSLKPPKTLCLSKPPIKSLEHALLESRFGKWMEILSSPAPGGSREPRDSARRLRNLARFDDLAALLSNRFACRRQWIRPDEVVHQLESRGLTVLGNSAEETLGSALRLDLQHTLRSIDEVLAALETPLQHCEVMFTETTAAYELCILGGESIATEDFAALERQWADVAWPNFDAEMEFTAGLGLSRERLRCQGGELELLRDASGRFGFCLQLPKNEPASYLPGFVRHLRRRLEFPGTEVGFFLIHEPCTDHDLGELLAPWLGSCGWIQQRGEKAWLLIAPVSRSEVTDFFEALEDHRRQGLETQGTRPRSSTPFQASVVAHVRIEEELAHWIQAVEAVWQQADTLVEQGPIVVLADEASPWFESLAARLSDSGGEVVHASVAEPYDSAGEDPDSLQTSTVLDLRPPQAADWSRLERLVGDGLLHRRIYLLTDDLRKQNDRLAAWVEAWGERLPAATEATVNLPSRAEERTIESNPSHQFAID